MNTPTARLVESRIVIDSPASFRLAGFAKSLPYPRELRGRGWSCAATPYAALRISQEMATDERVDDLAALWRRPELRDAQPPRTKLQAWAHQRRAYWFAESMPAAGLFLGMGCGKTKIGADLLLNWGVKIALILCPKAVVPVWPKELAKHYAGPFRCLPLTSGTTKQKYAEVDAAIRFKGNDDNLLAVIVNYETAWRDPLAGYLLSRRWPAVLLDESHKIKDPGGRASKFCAQLGLVADRRLCLTGTPMPHSPLDIFAQYRFLDPAIFGTSYVDFRSRYAVTHPEYKTKVLKWINQEQLAALIALCSMQITTAEAGLSLPPVQHIERSVPLEPATKKIYDQLEDELVAEIEQAGTVQVNNPLTKLLRLQQICCGFVATEDEFGERDVHKLGTEKSDALAELLEEAAGSPVVVFCRFVHDLAEVERVTGGLGLRYRELSGRRRELAADATYPTNTDVLGVQVQSGGAGIDLTRASIAVFYSVGCISHGDFDQACARLNRPGQTQPVRFYHLIAEKTVDELAYKAIRDGKEIVDFVLHSMNKEPAL